MTLSDYADLEGTEWGEAMHLLLQLQRYGDYLNKEFAEAIANEIANQLQYVKENTHIVESTTTVSRTVQTLEWNRD